MDKEHSDHFRREKQIHALNELRELKSLHGEFRSNHIPYLVIKGAALCHSHYRNPWDRPHVDVDIWIPARARKTVTSILIKLGYKCAANAQPEFLQSQFVMFCSERDVTLDIHLEISNAPPFASRLRFAPCFETRKILHIAGVEIPTLNDKDALILACIHPVMHHYSGTWGHLYKDIAPLFQSLTPDKRLDFFAEVQKLGLSQICAHALRQCGLTVTLPTPRFEILRVYPILARSEARQMMADLLLAPLDFKSWLRPLVALFPAPTYMLQQSPQLSGRLTFLRLPYLYMRRLFSPLRKLPMALLLILICNLAIAQPADEKKPAEGLTFNGHKGYDFGLTGGVLLPYNEPSLPDTYKMWGGEFSHTSILFSRMEYQILHVRDNGVAFYNFAWTFRMDFEVSDFFLGFFGAGLDFNLMQRAPEPYSRGGGFHLAFGHYFPFGKRLRLRSEVKFNNASGRSFYVGTGLMYLFGDEKPESGSN